MDLHTIQQQLEEGINAGINTLENYHKDISDNIYTKLHDIEMFAGRVDSVRTFTDSTADSFYNFAKNINEKSGLVIRDIFEKLNL